MRFKLTLSVDRQRCILPINYQYELSAWIYRTLHCGDPAFSKWLHERGYSAEPYGKRFKLFVFSRIFIEPRWDRRGDRLIIHSGKANFELSFYADQAIETFVIGLFANQQFSIGDKKSSAAFTVASLERLSDPDFGSRAEFQTISPICISRSRGAGEGAEYLRPDHPQYRHYFFNHLLHKYIVANRLETDLESVREEMTARQPLQFELLKPPQGSGKKAPPDFSPRLITIKANTPQETRVRGFDYRFRVQAPPELIQFGYQCGFGEKNSLGFGCVRNNN